MGSVCGRITPVVVQSASSDTFGFVARDACPLRCAFVLVCCVAVLKWVYISRVGFMCDSFVFYLDIAETFLRFVSKMMGLIVKNK